MTAPPTPTDCGRTGFDGPCNDPSCACHASFWDAAVLAALKSGPPGSEHQPLTENAHRRADRAGVLADVLVAWRAGRVARMKAMALEQRARKDHPSKAWDD